MIPRFVIRLGFQEFVLKHAFHISAAERELATSRLEAEEILRAWCLEPTGWPDAVRLYERLSNSSIAAPTDAEIAAIITHLQDEVARGELIVLRTQIPKQSAANRPRPKPKPQPPPAPPPKLLVRSFAVRIVDEIGQAIASVDLTIEHAGRDSCTTDGNGVARVEDSPAGTAIARFVSPGRLRKALKPRWDKPRGERKWLDESQGITVVELRGTLPAIDLVAEKLRVVSIQPFVARARLEGGYFDTDKAFLLPNGLDGIRATLKMAQSFGRTAVLVVGHTDTAGRQTYNDVLSVERAQTTTDILTQNVDGWTKWYGEGVPAEKRWGTCEDHSMLRALPDASDCPAGETLVHWFQRTRGLAVDGIAGPKTRAALIAEYMTLVGDPLPAGTNVIVHGCGENFPREKTGDGISDPENRRVEVFFFDGELGVQPPPPGKNSKAGAPEYPEWERRAKLRETHSTDGAPLSIELVSSDEFHIPEAEYVVTFVDGTVRTGRLDKTGHAELTGVPSCAFWVEYPDQDDIRAKALAVRIHAAFRSNDAQVILGVLSQPAEQLARISAAYDDYYNDIGGRGLVDDAYAVLGDTDDGVAADHLIASAGLPAQSGATMIAYVEPPSGAGGDNVAGGAVA